MASVDISNPTSGNTDAPTLKPAGEEQQHHEINYLVRLSQLHEDFRLAELHALAQISHIPITILSYTPSSPILLLTAPSPTAATTLVHRAILTQAVYEHWGSGPTLDALHASVKTTSAHLWPRYTTSSWKFSIDAFQGGGGAARSAAQRNALINTFRYLPLKGPIRMSNPDLELTIFEEYHPAGHAPNSASPLPSIPHAYHLGRFLGRGARDLAATFDLKKRPYISTTSMAADLTLVTANIALAAPGKLFYDPFAGTGSFPLASAAFGAVSWGSDIDGRAVRGSGNDARDVKGRGKVKGERTVRGNFVFYGLEGGLGDVFTCDLTNSPLRRVAFGQGAAGGRRRLFDGVMCDPPYGVREGLRVLGCKDPEGTPWVVEAGVAKYKDPSFIPPKKPYSFHAMLHDILHFASETLVDNGRLAFWMPTANDHDQELAIPTHPCLELVSVCVQPFNRWSRRLITYRKLPDEDVAPPEAVAEWLCVHSQGKLAEEGVTADELNPFRKGYFSKFVKDTPPPEA